MRESRKERKHLVRKDVGADWNRAGRRGMTTLAHVRIEAEGLPTIPFVSQEGAFYQAQHKRGVGVNMQIRGWPRLDRKSVV